MKSTRSALIAAMFLVAFSAAHAGDAESASIEVHGVKLRSVCATCGVVSETHAETRKGKASGLGAVGGAVLGGLVGNRVGGGSGKAAVTVLGAVGGGVAGNAVEKNVKKTTVWVTTVVLKDGTTHTYERTSDPALRAGDVVTLESGEPVRR
jgi:outer membrane lipoprotein SlyB